MKLNVGDSVKLMATKYGIHPSNPVSRTKYACNGIITEIIFDYYDSRLFPIKVLWNNGYSNNYSENDLKVCLSSTKNYKSTG